MRFVWISAAPLRECITKTGQGSADSIAFLYDKRLSSSFRVRVCVSVWIPVHREVRTRLHLDRDLEARG